MYCCGWIQPYIQVFCVCYPHFADVLHLIKYWFENCGFTGIKGWYPIYLPNGSDVHDATSYGDNEKVVGGLELRLNFSEAKNRDHIIHVSRGVGWSPPAGVECDDNWLDEVSQERHWKFSLKVNKAWIPPSELYSFYSGAKKMDKGVKMYARYKLCNKGMLFHLRHSSVITFVQVTWTEKHWKSISIAHKLSSSTTDHINFKKQGSK